MPKPYTQYSTIIVLLSELSQYCVFSWVLFLFKIYGKLILVLTWIQVLPCPKPYRVETLSKSKRQRSLILNQPVCTKQWALQHFPIFCLLHINRGERKGVRGPIWEFDIMIFFKSAHRWKYFSSSQTGPRNILFWWANIKYKNYQKVLWWTQTTFAFYS